MYYHKILIAQIAPNLASREIFFGSTSQSVSIYGNAENELITDYVEPISKLETISEVENLTSISSPLTRKGSHAENKASPWTKIVLLFKCSQFSCLLLQLARTAKFLKSRISGACAEAKSARFFIEKKCIRHFVWAPCSSVHFLVSLISTYPTLHVAKKISK